MLSQRFRGLTTLEGCLAGTRVMQAGDQDSVAVRRIQEVLAELGYMPWAEEDGLFGERTGRAVTRYKQDHGLTPDNPVIGSGTMGALDQEFAWEPVDPDSPDPSTDGLVALAESARDTALDWVGVAAAAVAAWPQPPAPGEGLDLERTRYEDALRTHLRFQRTADEQPTFDLSMAPMTDALGRLLGELRFAAHDRASFIYISSTYEPLDMTPGMVINVSPPFRNVMTDAERAGQVLRYAANCANPAARIMGFPEHPRYATLTLHEGLGNVIAWAAFCAACAGGTPGLRPEPRWHH